MPAGSVSHRRAAGSQLASARRGVPQAARAHRPLILHSMARSAPIGHKLSTVQPRVGRGLTARRHLRGSRRQTRGWASCAGRAALAGKRTRPEGVALAWDALEHRHCCGHGQCEEGQHLRQAGCTLTLCTPSRARVQKAPQGLPDSLPVHDTVTSSCLAIACMPLPVAFSALVVPRAEGGRAWQGSCWSWSRGQGESQARGTGDDGGARWGTTPAPTAAAG